MRHSTAEQDEWVLTWIRENPPEASALNSQFHDDFQAKFGGRHLEVMWGASTNKKAMATLRRLHKSGKLHRKIIELGCARQPGFPNWCWSYFIPRQDT